MRVRGHWGRRIKAKTVVKEARAVLDGHARTTTYGSWPRVPPWAYVNQLAHGERADLVRLADHGWSQYHRKWDDACAYLAGELLARADEGHSLTEAQRALIPLELDLLDGAYPCSVSPAMLVGWVSHALAVAGFGRAAH
jgi:hypothetical protein